MKTGLQRAIKHALDKFDRFTCWVLSQRSQISDLKMILAFEQINKSENGGLRPKNGPRPKIKILKNGKVCRSLRDPTCQFVIIVRAQTSEIRHRQTDNVRRGKMGGGSPLLKKIRKY